MHIGELAERTGLSLRTIRHYDEVGLVVPSGRTDGGFRLYTEQDLERLLVIRRMKPLGFSLEEMRQILVIVDGLAGSGSGPVQAGLRRDLATFLERATAQRDDLARQLEMADELIAVLRAR